jgi:hypothetical protein
MTDSAKPTPPLLPKPAYVPPKRPAPQRTEGTGRR